MTASRCRRSSPGCCEGYASITALPDDFQQQLRTWSLLIGLRSLARSIAKGAPTGEDTRRHLRAAIRRDLAAMHDETER